VCLKTAESRRGARKGGEWRTCQQKAGSSDEMGIARAEEAVYGSAIASTTPSGRSASLPTNDQKGCFASACLMTANSRCVGCQAGSRLPLLGSPRSAVAKLLMTIVSTFFVEPIYDDAKRNGRKDGQTEPGDRRSILSCFPQLNVPRLAMENSRSGAAC
jgi:hypothetical protein